MNRQSAWSGNGSPKPEPDEGDVGRCQVTQALKAMHRAMERPFKYDKKPLGGCKQENGVIFKTSPWLLCGEGRHP